jgi:bacterioferritin (cytochrome b1)
VEKEALDRHLFDRLQSGEQNPFAQPPDSEGPLHQLLEQMLGPRLQQPEAAPQADPRAQLLHHLLGLKYQLIIAYINYGDRLQAFYRDGVHQHFQTHVEEERQQAYEVTKRLTALGHAALPNVPPVPEVSSSDFRGVLEALLKLEEQSVVAWQQLFNASQDDAALNGLAQNGALQDQQHTDDMLRYLGASDAR